MIIQRIRPEVADIEIMRRVRKAKARTFRLIPGREHSERDGMSSKPKTLITDVGINDASIAWYGDAVRPLHPYQEFER